MGICIHSHPQSHTHSQLPGTLVPSPAHNHTHTHTRILSVIHTGRADFCIAPHSLRVSVCLSATLAHTTHTSPQPRLEVAHLPHSQMCTLPGLHSGQHPPNAGIVAPTPPYTQASKPHCQLGAWRYSTIAALGLLKTLPRYPHESQTRARAAV